LLYPDVKTPVTKFVPIICQNFYALRIRIGVLCGLAVSIRVTVSILISHSLSDTDTPAPSTPRILETIAEAAETVTGRVIDQFDIYDKTKLFLAAPLTESPTALRTSAQQGQADVGKSPKSRHRYLF